MSLFPSKFRPSTPLILVVALGLVVPSGMGNSISLPLPQWDESGPPDDSFLSDSLFPENSFPYNPDGVAPILPPRNTGEKILPLIEPLDLQPLVVLAGDESPERAEAPQIPGESEVALEDLQVYRTRPESLLVNPQHLLSEPQEFDLTEFLDYHAGESGIPIYILVADGNQRLPDRFNLQSFVDQWFSDSPACVILYYLGHPSRSEVALSPPIRNAAGSVSGVEVLEHSTADALVASDPIDQLSRFSVRTSIQMFWLEKRLRDPDASLAGHGEISTFATLLATLRSVATSPIFYIGLLALAALVSAANLVRSWWVARTGGRVYIFPEFVLTTRLGAPHCGGSDAVVDFERS